MNKWTEFKSWWYWKVSSKYDIEDIGIFVFLPTIILLMTTLAILAANEKHEYAAQCEKNGGIVVATHKRYYCIDKKVILNDERNN